MPPNRQSSCRGILFFLLLLLLLMLLFQTNADDAIDLGILQHTGTHVQKLNAVLFTTTELGSGLTYPKRVYAFSRRGTTHQQRLFRCLWWCALELLLSRRAAARSLSVGSAWCLSIGIAITLTIVCYGETATPRIQCHVATRASLL